MIKISHHRLTRGLAFASVGIVTLGFATPIQGPSEAGQKVVSEAFKLQNEGKYMKALDQLETFISSAGAEDKEAFGQLLGTLYSYVGEQEKADKLFSNSIVPKKGEPPATSPLSETTPVDALDEIVKLAKDRQIVILNEAHHVPRHRAFSSELARELRKIGYEYFAAETFNEKVGDLWPKGYPTRGIGFYTVEPVFGDLVRQAMKLGYKPVPYEAKDFLREGDQVDRVNHRETQQANNLIERVLKANPKAKIFIHCGYSHATENWRKVSGKDYAWMAARLGKLTGIDPLTIDQTGETPSVLPNDGTPQYLFAESKGWLTEPRVFRQSDGKYAAFGTWKDAVDMQVFHPREKLVDGRPDWLSMGGYRKPLKVDAVGFYKSTGSGFEKTSGRVLLQAFVKGEGDDAVAMDQIVVESGDAAPVLMLPPGEYRLVFQTKDGESKPWKDVKVS